MSEQSSLEAVLKSLHRDRDNLEKDLEQKQDLQDRYRRAIPSAKIEDQQDYERKD